MIERTYILEERALYSYERDGVLRRLRKALAEEHGVTEDEVEVLCDAEERDSFAVRLRCDCERGRNGASRYAMPAVAFDEELGSAIRYFWTRCGYCRKITASIASIAEVPGVDTGEEKRLAAGID